MAIYLDTNVFRDWEPSTVNRSLLLVLAERLEQDVFISELAFVEAREHRRRVLEGVQASVEKVGRDVERHFGERFEPDAVLDVDHRLASWERQMHQLATILPLEGRHAAEALTREARRQPPARAAKESATGGRDAAIWLAVRDHHLARQELSYLLTGDGAFFGSKGLPEALQAELDVDAYTLTPVHSVAELAEGALTPVPDVPADWLGVVALEAVQDALRWTDDVPDAAVSLPDYFHFRTDVYAARVLRVHASYRLPADGAEQLIVDSEWELLADINWRTESLENWPDIWQRFEAVDLTGRLQLYIDEDQKATLLASDLTSRVDFSPARDGRVVRMSTDSPSDWVRAQPPQSVKPARRHHYQSAGLPRLVEFTAKGQRARLPNACPSCSARRTPRPILLRSPRAG